MGPWMFTGSHRGMQGFCQCMDNINQELSKRGETKSTWYQNIEENPGRPLFVWGHYQIRDLVVHNDWR